MELLGCILLLLLASIGAAEAVCFFARCLFVPKPRPESLRVFRLSEYEAETVVRYARLSQKAGEEILLVGTPTGPERRFCEKQGFSVYGEKEAEQMFENYLQSGKE